MVYINQLLYIHTIIHNNIFSIKDVLKIQTGIVDNLTKPMASILSKLNQTQVGDNDAVKSKLNTLSSVFSNPFQYCNTEYYLEKWLVQNEYVTDLLQFTTHNEINNVQMSGETIYGENTTKGVLLLINEQFKKYIEYGDNLNNFLNKFNLLKNDSFNIISNFVQGGDLWKQKNISV